MAASCPPVIPVPETGTVTVELVFVPDNPPPCPFPLCPCVETTKASEILPLSGPPAGGVKLTLTATLWPGANVSGIVSPISVNPFPFTVACEMVRLDPPEFARVAD